MYANTEWIRQQVTDVLLGDVALEESTTPMLKIAHRANCFYMKCANHHGGNSLNDVANPHVTMAESNCEYFGAPAGRGTEGRTGLGHRR